MFRLALSRLEIPPRALSTYGLHFGRVHRCERTNRFLVLLGASFGVARIIPWKGPPISKDGESLRSEVQAPSCA